MANRFVENSESERSEQIMAEFSARERLCLWLAKDQFREILRERIGELLVDLERLPLETVHGERRATHHFYRYLADVGGEQFWVTKDRAMPISYDPPQVSPNLCNLRLVVDESDGLIAAGCSVPNSRTKALEAVLPTIRHRIAKEGLSGEVEMAITIHSLLSTSILQPAEQKMVLEEIEAFQELVAMGPIEVDGVTVKVVPIVINTQSNVLAKFRNGPLRSLAGYSLSDQVSFQGLVELIDRALRASLEGSPMTAKFIIDRLREPATSLEEQRDRLARLEGDLRALGSDKEEIDMMIAMVSGRSLTGERIDPVAEGLYLHKLSQLAGGSYLVHCKSGLDRTGGMLAAIGARYLAPNNDEEFRKAVLDSVNRTGKPTTWMSTGVSGIKFGSGLLQNPLLEGYLPFGVATSFITGASQLRGF